MKLVKNNKIAKLPRGTRTVKQAIRRAEEIAERDGWTKIVIIGEDKNRNGSDLSSRMKSSDMLIMLETSKFLLLHDWLIK